MREGVEEMLEERVAQLRGPVAPTASPAPLTRNAATAGDGQRSVVRQAVALLLQNPSFAENFQPPYTFVALRKPGIALLVELLGVCRARPNANSATLLEHYRDREEAAALRKLAVLDLHGDPKTMRQEFTDSLRRLELQTMQQRIDDLVVRQGEASLDDAEKAELRSLLLAKRG
jgi:DNA primase